MTKIKAKMFLLRRAEGPIRMIGERVATSWEHANAVLALWRTTAPEAGYHKVDFEITFEDGESYRGRYDLEKTSSCRLQRHVKEHLEFVAGLAASPEEKRSTYQRLVKEYKRLGLRGMYRKFLNLYEIPD